MKKIFSILTFSLFLLFSIGCIVPKNNGLLTYTIINHQANYTHTSDTQLIWDHMPLTYKVYGDQTLIKRAAREWNSQLRFTAFIPAAENDLQPDIVIHTSVPIVYVINESNGTRNNPINQNDMDVIGGSCSHTFDLRGRMHANVIVHYLPTNRLEYIAAMHELGHAIGLDHDDFNSSIMRRTIRDDTEVPWNAPPNTMALGFSTYVDEGDRRLLKRLYKNHN